MKAPVLLMLVQILFGAALAWSCFCRLVKTNGETRREIRWAITLEGAAAGIVMGAPILPLLVPEFMGRGSFRWQPWTTPLWAWVLLLISATLVQFVTAKFWRHGVPPDFQEEATMKTTRLSSLPRWAKAAAALLIMMCIVVALQGCQEHKYRPSEPPANRLVLRTQQAQEGAQTIQVPAVRVAQCRAEGGCWIVSRKQVDEMVEEAYHFGRADGAATCKGKAL